MNRGSSAFNVPRLKYLALRIFALGLVVYVIVVTSSPPTNTNKRLRQQSNKSLQLSAMAAPNLRAGSVLLSTAPIPSLLYGTAWKKERTEELVELAIRTGFRGIDTACQPKHYYEPGVGAAMQKLVQEGVISRDKIFLQTKFTSLNGQDPNNIPYNKNAPLTEQVQQSFAKSLENLKTDYLDSLVLHSPMGTLEDTMTVWRVFERLYGEKRVLNLGISNCYELDMLKSIYEAATIKPVFLQNRFYKTSGYDRAIRQFCREHGITYQSFWTLTANPTVVQSSTITAIANKYGKTNTQVFFRFLQTQVCSGGNASPPSYCLP